MPTLQWHTFETMLLHCAALQCMFACVYIWELIVGLVLVQQMISNLLMHFPTCNLLFRTFIFLMVNTCCDLTLHIPCPNQCFTYTNFLKYITGKIICYSTFLTLNYFIQTKVNIKNGSPIIEIKMFREQF